MAIVSRLQIDHPALDDPGGAPLHTQVEDNFIKIGDNLSARYFEGIAVANGATVIFDHNFKMPFGELAFKVYLLAGAGGELTVTTESDYDIVATPGNLTTQISVTNNSGGVSTFAVLIQSLGGGGGGGQTLYDVIIDAAGNGDYASFKTAIETEPVDTTFYIRNGAYAETALTQMKEGQKVYGESRDGVVLSFNIAASPAIRAPRTSSGFSRGRTRRTGDNGAWDTVNGLGLLTVVQGSATATYSGNTNPSPTDICLIGPSGDQFEIDVVDAGLNTVTLDAVWKGPSGPTDWIVNRVASTASWKDQVHGLFNLTIRTTNATGRGIELSTTLNFVLKDVAMFSVSTSASDPMFDAKTVSARVTLENVDFISEHLTLTTAAIRMATGASHFKFKNCKMVGCSANSINGQITDPMVYNDFHFSSISQASGGDCFIDTDFCAYSSFKVDRLTSVSSIFDSSPSSSFAEWFDCDFEFGLIDDLHGVLHIGSARSRFSIKKGYQQYTQILINVNALRTDENTNVLHDSWLQNSIRFTASSNHLIIASSVIYGGIFDANEPVWNTGWDHTSPPSLGGGQTLYDVVVDAAGGGDYVNLKTAYDTEPAGTTIYIRNGSYSVSTFITIKPGTKVIGESRNGVVIEYTSSSWGLFRADFGAYRGGTERVANNTAWDTTSIGTISATNGTNILVYTGATNPVAGDLIHVEPNFYALISSVDTGLKEITIDRNWGNDTASGLDCMVLDTIVTDTEARSEFSNFTCVLNNGGQTSLVKSFNSMYNCHFSNIKLYAEAVGSGAFLVFLQATLRCSLDDIEIDANDTSTTKAFLIFNGISDLHVRNLIAYNIPGSAVQLGGGVKAIRRSTLHFKSLSCDQYALASETGIYRSLIKIDNILAGRICTGGSGTASFFESKITVERASLSETFTKFDSAKSIHSVNYVNNNVQVTNPVGGSTLHNIITDSYIDGTLTVDSETVISGSVAYDAISGVPAQNNGFEF